MDLYEAIRKLYEEKKRLEHAIKELEKLRAGDRPPAAEPSARRRGRHSMGRAERLQVSQRMRKYWAARRKNRPSATP
jgi:hypothetical protein